MSRRHLPDWWFTVYKFLIAVVVGGVVLMFAIGEYIVGVVLLVLSGLAVLDLRRMRRRFGEPP